jgi:hypothetical protein
VKSRTIVGLVALLALVGCDPKELFEKSVPKEEAEFSKKFLALLQARDFEAIEAKVAPNMKGAQLRPNVEKIAAFFPAEKPNDIQIVGAQTFANADTTQVSLTFQYVYPGKWVVANVVLEKKGGDTVVAGVTVRPLPDSLENINRFTFEGKGATHYVMFAFAIIVPLFIVAATISCIKTPIPKRKWLWVVFILFGLARATLNWTDGNLNFNLLSFLMLGASFSKTSPYGPWFLSVSIPIGAIVFMLRRKEWLLQKAQ